MHEVVYVERGKKMVFFDGRDNTACMRVGICESQISACAPFLKTCSSVRITNPVVSLTTIPKARDCRYTTALDLFVCKGSTVESTTKKMKSSTEEM